MAESTDVAGAPATAEAVDAAPLDLDVPTKGPAPRRRRVNKTKVERAATIVRTPQPDLDVAPAGSRPARPAKDIATDEEIARAVGGWLAVPEAEREHATLPDLAKAEGYTVTRVYNALRNPWTFSQALTATAAAIVPRLPAVLGTLAEEAEDGNVRAADSLLRHCRELARMAEETGDAGAGGNLAAHLEQTAGLARTLVDLADSLSERRPSLAETANAVPVEEAAAVPAAPVPGDAAEAVTVSPTAAPGTPESAAPSLRGGVSVAP